MGWLKQSTAVTIQVGPFIATGGVAVATGLTPAIEISKANAAWVTIGATGAVAYSSGGWYRRPLSTVDTGTLGRFLVKSEGAGYLPVWHEHVIVAANVYDSLIATGDRLDVNTAQYAGATTATGDIKTVAAVAAGVWSATVARTLTSAGVVWTAAARGLTSKVGFALTTGQHDSIGTRAWAVAARTLTSAGVVWTAAARGLTSKVGFALTTGQHDSIGTRGWAVAARTLTSGGNVASSVWGRTQAELTAVPTATAAAGTRLMFLYMGARNFHTTTATGDKIHNSASVGFAKAPLSASTTAFTKGKYVTVTG